ncbi:DUF2563 family protein [Mycobacterium botniense]|uniref:DUF2563 domain-containing protein n=1 Tax=Mycobacterium botniense TaxID=84962 RepID=A0A7I9XZQ4_9MYCO|nr:DUF2563 family protein [Mycobacterium botniense]GFG75288.1 hypothetical protein MBOT_26530 [Mycobacterium botniense]
MFVNPVSLHIGAGASERAGDHAGAGADRLSLAGVVGGMFGDFDAAHDFHQVLRAAKDHHTQRLHKHHDNLTGIAATARSIAAAFTEMDRHNAKRLCDVVVDDDSR